MTIDKDSQLWTQLKAGIKIDHVLRDVQDTITPNLNTTFLALKATCDNNRQEEIDIEGVMSESEGINDSLDSTKVSTNALLDNIILSLVTSEGYTANLDGDIESVLNQIKDDMDAAGHFILENTVGVAAAAAGGSNVGNGDVIADNIDGEALPQEGIKPESLTLLCTIDGQLGGEPGTESFAVLGELDSLPEENPVGGSGVGDDVEVASSGSVLDNGDMENFTADDPDNWDIVTGAAGVDIFEETAAQAFGTACLKFLNTAVDPKITQALVDSVSKNTKYLLSAMINTTGLTVGSVTIKITGTGLAYAGSEIINVVAGAGFTRYNATLNIPNDVRDDIKIEVYTTGVDADVYIDDICLTEFVEHNGIFIAINRGLVDFVIDDVFTIAITNDRAGNINTHVNDYYDFQFTTAAVGANTVIDTL